MTYPVARKSSGKKSISVNEDLEFDQVLNFSRVLLSSGDKKRYNIVKQIILNICKNPQDPKFLELKRTNKNIKDLLENSSVYKFLTYIGFNEVSIE